MKKMGVCAGMALCAAAAWATEATAGVNLTWHYRDQPYLSRSDSLFAAAETSSFFLEDFEDGALNLAGVSASAGQVRGPRKKTDSVDFDDGFMNGLGRAGHNWFVGKQAGGVTFTFDAEALGGLPTSAGLVWTDGKASKPITFEAFDGYGNLLGSMIVNLGDGFSRGQTAEDRFLGVTFEGGISAIRISAQGTRIELDHLQYGGMIPAPGALSLLGLAGIMGRRRRRS
jgi:hypothetical protein